MSVKQLFVTGIGTEVGKTVCSAILAQCLEAEYWKPVQAGDLEYSDTHKLQQWVSFPSFVTHPEAYRLSEPMSPHAAAERDGVTIQLESFKLPQTSQPLIVEGAGGLMVPLNDHDLMLDLIAHLNIPTVVVSRHYLGSINHTLLTLHLLKQNNLPLEGIIFNGNSNLDTESVILRHAKKLFGTVRVLGYVGDESDVNPDMIQRYAEEWKSGMENSEGI